MLSSNKHNYRKIDILKEITSNISEKNIKINYIKKSVDPRNYRVSFQKIKKILGFVPKYSLKYGIKEIILNINKCNFNSKNLGNFVIKKNYEKNIINRI